MIDYYGNTVKNGKIHSDGTSDKIIDLTGDLDVGYYDVVIYAPEGNVPLARTSISIVDNYEFETNSDTSLFGVNTHIGQNYTNYLTALMSDETKKLGVGNVRDGYVWSEVEKTKGNISISDTSLIYSGYVNDIGLYVTGGFGNAIYTGDNKNPPTTTEALNAFAAYANKIGSSFNKKYPLKEFEVWNEYWAWDYDKNNIDSSVNRYANIFDATYNVMSQSYPETKLLTCFANKDTPVDKSWNEKILKTKVASQMDVATIHCYGGTQNDATEKRPEIVSPVLSSIDSLRSLMEENGAGDKEIWLTETGYATMPIDINGNSIIPKDNTNAKKYCISEKEAGMYLPRLMLLSLSKGCTRIYNYQLLDYYYSPNDQDSFYGLLRGPETVCGIYSPKPGYSSYAALIRALDNTHFVNLSINNGSCYEYTFANDNKTVTAVYSIDGESTYTYYTDVPVTVTDIMGKSVEMSPENGQISLTIDGNVKYIRKNL